jgi:hypothetical protein
MASDINFKNLARDAAVEALDHTVGLWRVGLGLPVRHREFCAGSAS